MSLRYDCPGCGEEIVVRYLDAGDVAQCPHCGAEAAVPEDAETVDGPSPRVDPKVPKPPLPRPGREIHVPTRRRSRYIFLRILPWIILVGAALHIIATIIALAAVSRGIRGLSNEPNFIGAFMLWVPIEILIALGLAQGIWAALEIVENTRAVLPPPADTFD
ncbi:MAG: hypothetical protein ABFS86_12190 [Planctomycetota bacterium]